MKGTFTSLFIIIFTVAGEGQKRKQNKSENKRKPTNHSLPTLKKGLRRLAIGEGEVSSGRRGKKWNVTALQERTRHQREEGYQGDSLFL